MPDDSHMDPEAEMIDNLDEKIAQDKKKFNQSILNFIRKNKHKFKDYRKYFSTREAYLKDKKMLEAKLADNQDVNNPRQRVNSEALQEELDRMKNNLANLKNRLDLESLPISESLLNKIVNLPAGKLGEFEARLEELAGVERPDKKPVKEKASGAETSEAA